MVVLPAAFAALVQKRRRRELAAQRERELDARLGELERDGEQHEVGDHHDVHEEPVVVVAVVALDELLELVLRAQRVRVAVDRLGEELCARAATRERGVDKKRGRVAGRVGVWRSMA